MDRNLALEFVRVTEAAAIAAAKWIGRGDKKMADRAAVDEMRSRFNQIDFCGRVVIGEGKKDEAPELYTGEVLGRCSDPSMDIAVDPLECTDSVAWGRYNAISVIAAGPKGSLLEAPDTYMEKIAVGREAAGVIDIDAPVKDNLARTAKALGKNIGEVVVVVLDRPRHERLIREIREAGARIRLITDGDVAAAVATCLPDSGIDLLMGIGGSTEAVLAAVPLKTFGGEMLCRFVPRGDDDLLEIRSVGIDDIAKIFSVNDMAKGNSLSFTATGVIDGPLLNGVVFKRDRIVTHSMAIRSTSGTVRYMTTHHEMEK